MIPKATDRLQALLENDPGPSGTLYREIDGAMNRTVPTDHVVKVRVPSPLLMVDFDPVNELLLHLGYKVELGEDEGSVLLRITTRRAPRP